MDIPRPSQAKKILRRRIAWGVAIGAAVIGMTVGLTRLKPAAPTLEKDMVWIGTVKRGDMVRQVRGLGTLVPEDTRWLAARSAGRVDEIVLRPGATVQPEDVILRLSNPDVTQAADAAASQLLAGEAELSNLKVTLQRSVLDEEAALAKAKSDFETSKLRAEVNEDLAKDGLVAPLDLRLSKVDAEEAATRYEIEKKRYAFAQEAIAPQLAVKQAEVDRLRAQAKLKKDESEALNVKAGMSGVLQALPVEIGAQVQPGTNLARVADPARLKAEVRIPETQAKDIQIGQKSLIDTRNGVVEGTVARVDPAVQNGTVLVDVSLPGELPRGARPDLSVDGTIQLERLDDVLYVERPTFGQEGSKIGLFRIDPDGSSAIRTQVELGRSSVNTIEVISGLKEGDHVILTEKTDLDGFNEVRLR